MAKSNCFSRTLGQSADYGIDHDFKNISDFIASNARRFPDLPAVGFYIPSSDRTAAWGYRIVTFAEVQRGVCTTANTISESLHTDGRETIALLCPSTAEFLFTWLGLMKLGHPALLIAPQCSPSGIVDLCKQCKVRHLFCDEIYRDLAHDASQDFGTADGKLEIHPMPFGKDQDPCDQAHGTKCAPDPASSVDKHDVAYLHHTSGTSSGSPKPIPQTHYAGIGVNARQDDSQHSTFTTTPLYHGGVADLFRSWSSNALIWLFPGKDVPTTATNIIKCLDNSRTANAPPIKYFSSVPYVLEMMAAEERGLQFLREMDIVGVGGAALPTEIGNVLVKRGVNLISRFGSAECGFLMSSYRDFAEDQDWQYLRLHEESKWLRFEPRDDDLYELVILSGWPHMAKRNRDDGSFATSDLFTPHLTISDAWRYDSRADSQITLITGKKFDPAPLEGAIAAKSQMLQDVLVFGEGKPYPGALLFRSHKSGEMSDDQVASQIAVQVEKLNRGGQKHTQIPRNALIVMPYVELPLEKSSKGTILRNKAEERYFKEIEAAYGSDSSDHQDIADTAVEEYILNTVSSIMKSCHSNGKTTRLEAETDLFSLGVDSVACIQIRKAVSRLLPRASPALPLTVVQDTGSVRELSELIIDSRHGRTIKSANSEDIARIMQDFVQKYSHPSVDSKSDQETLQLTPPRSPGKHSNGRTILLTGPTGSLGSHLLHQLLLSTDVTHIHLLVRGATQQAASERVRKALTSKKLRITTDFDTKVSIHTYSLTQPYLGLTTETYTNLVGSVDTVYHLAWAVDFTLPIRAFEPHFIGLQSLLTLSLHSKSKFIFCSSTASVSSTSTSSPIPESIISYPKSAGSIGYSQSKWVAENICNNFSARHDARHITIIRVGQLSGDSIHGIWNRTEAYPIMLSSAKVTKCLPDLGSKGDTAWVPVDLAARAFVDIMRTEEEGVKVLHLLSQDTTSTTWRMFLDWIVKDTDIDVVGVEGWLKRLEGIETEHPSSKLLGFWKGAYGGVEDEGEKGNVEFEMEKSFKAMPSLRELKPVDKEYALKLWKWIEENV